MSAVVHFVCFLRKDRDKGDSGRPGYGFCKVMDTIAVRAPSGRWGSRGYHVMMVLDEREEAPGHLIRDRGIPVFLPLLEEHPVDVFLEAEGKTAHKGPFVMAQGYPLLALRDQFSPACAGHADRSCRYGPGSISSRENPSRPSPGIWDVPGDNSHQGPECPRFRSVR